VPSSALGVSSFNPPSLPLSLSPPRRCAFFFVGGFLLSVYLFGFPQFHFQQDEWPSHTATMAVAGGLPTCGPVPNIGGLVNPLFSAFLSECLFFSTSHFLTAPCPQGRHQLWILNHRSLQAPAGPRFFPTDGHPSPSHLAQMYAQNQLPIYRDCLPWNFFHPGLDGWRSPCHGGLGHGRIGCQDPVGGCRWQKHRRLAGEGLHCP